MTEAMQRANGLLKTMLVNGHLILMSAAAAALALTILVVFYIAVLQNPDPVYENHLLSVTPEHRIFDRDSFDSFRVNRRVCLSRAAQIEVLRAWTEAVPGDEVRPVLAQSSFQRELRAGCQDVTITQTIPRYLPPGQYVYEASIRACNPLGRCVIHALNAIPVSLIGGPWPHEDVPPPPPLHGSLSWTDGRAE